MARGALPSFARLVAIFALIFAACVAEKRCLSCTLKFSFCLALISCAGQMMMYAVQPFPGSPALHRFSSRSLTLPGRSIEFFKVVGGVVLGSGYEGKL